VAGVGGFGIGCWFWGDGDEGIFFDKGNVGVDFEDGKTCACEEGWVVVADGLAGNDF